MKDSSNRGMDPNTNSDDAVVKNDEFTEDLSTQWRRTKCLNCGYLYEGIEIIKKCIRCGNEDPDKFVEVE